jgi:glucosamine--fructose-6-phosphate aminotransferase (isomerizing)
VATSEQSAFPSNIHDYHVLNNFDICNVELNNNNTIAIDFNRNTIKKTVVKPEICSLDGYTYWTEKEIMEQKDSIKRAIKERIQFDSSVRLKGLDEQTNELLELDNLILLGCGTSFNSALIGKQYLQELCDFNSVQVIDGADFTLNDINKSGKTGLILISQSGETKDLHRCIKMGREKDIKLIGVINVVDSLIAREVDCGVYLKAGREIAVASTKSFTSQVIVLILIAIWFSKNIDKRKRAIDEIFVMINEIETTLNYNIGEIKFTENMFILGKGKGEFVAREGSLKIKEITYIHSEAYSGSSLKHGPFALLSDKFTVILIILSDEHYQKMCNVFEEIRSRDCNIIVITDVKDFDHSSKIIVPRTMGYFHAAIILQRIALYISLKKGINPDIPRNLAKVVTVE